MGGMLLFSVNQLKAQVTNTEGFEGTTFVPTGWTNENVSGTNLWSRVTAGTTPSQTPHTGAAEAKFDSYNTDAGVRALITPAYDLSNVGSNTATVSFWMYRDNGYNGNADKIDVLINTTATVVGATSLGTVNRNRSMAPIVVADGWYEYTFNVPGTFNGASNYLILQGTSEYGNNIFIDDVSWISYPPVCSGTPAPGNTLSSAASVCPSTPFTLTLQNATTGGGVTYQWQSSSDNVSYTDIPGETLASLTTTLSAATYYKCIVTCSSVSTASTAVQVGLNSFMDCYCTLAATSVADTDIGNVTIGSINNGTATPVMNNSTANGTYTDYTSLPAATISIGASTPISLSQITSGGTFYAAWFNVFIDYNHNGIFDLPSERAFTSTALTDELAPTQTGTIAVPATALTGQTRMRISLTESGDNAETPCGTFSYGEVEDYFVNITCPTMTAPVGTGASTCANNPATISVTPSLTGSSIAWYTVATGGTAIATTTSYTTPTLTATTSYWVEESIGSCPVSPRAEVIATVDPVNVILTPVDALCHGSSDGTFTLSNINCGTAPFTYAIDGGAFGAIPTNLAAGTYTVIAKGTGSGNQESAPMELVIGEPTLIISNPAGMDTSTCINASTIMLNAESTLSTYTTDTLVISFDVSAQPAEVNAAPGTLISTATMPALPEGAIISSVAVSYPGLTSLGSSWGMDVFFHFDGAISSPSHSGMGAPGSLSTFTYIDSIEVDSVDIAGGAINMYYWDSYDDNASADECTFPTGTGVATITITYAYPTPATITWWTAATGGTQIGTGNALETIGTSVLPTSGVLGTYNFYAQGENGGCSSDSRTLITVTLDSPNRTITALTCQESYTSPFGDVYDTTGMYYHVIPAVGPGCDSTVIIDLTVFETPTITILPGGVDLVASAGGTTFQWLNCTTGGYTPVVGATSSTYTATVNGSYAVIATNGPCSDTSACVTVNSVGLENVSPSNYMVRLAPNPTSDKVQLTLTGATYASVIVYDIQGKVILTIKDVVSGDYISLVGVETGIYTMKVVNEMGASTHRIVKQ